MKCNNCNNEIIAGKKFCGFCGSGSAYTPAPSSVVNNDNVGKPDKVLEIFKVIFFIVFIILPMLTVFWDKEEVKPPCRNTTREVQTIIKMDGAVDSVETETVDGCETPDGSFFQRPDL